MFRRSRVRFFAAFFRFSAFSAALSGLAPGAGAQSVTVRDDTTTTADGAHGVESTQDDAVIVIDGAAVRTAGNDASGIRSTGDGAEITVRGAARIDTAGSTENNVAANAFGIDSVGDGAVITVDGAIRTIGIDSLGIRSAGEDDDITLTGRIETTGRRAAGIRSEGAGAVITVRDTGTIDTTGDGAAGIYVLSSGTGTTIAMDGTIRTGPAVADDFGASSGIHVESADVTITMGGTIRTTNVDSFGISVGPGSGPANADITITGLIEASAAFAGGVNATGPNAEITVRDTGTIRTTGDDSHGIFLAGADSRTDVAAGGLVRTSGEFAHGIFVFDAANAEIDVAEGGTVLTTGANSHGIRSTGVDAGIRVGGTVETRGADALGIWSAGTDAGIDVAESGTVRTSGEFAYGVLSDGDEATIRVAGTVGTRGMTAFGIWSTGANAVIDIAAGGRIRTDGGFADGILSQSANADITVAGAIRTTGPGAQGIRAIGGGDTITISGGVHAVGRGSHAIFGLGGQTLRLLCGWDITGPVSLEAGQANRLELEGAGLSRTLHIPNLREVVHIGGGPVLRPGDGMFVVHDSRAPTMRRVALSQLTRAVHGAIRDRDAAARPVPDGASAGAGFGDRRIWSAAVGSDFGGDLDGGGGGADCSQGGGAASGWNGRLYGAVVGVEGALRGGLRVGVLGGYAHGEAATEAASIEAETGTGLLGVYGALGGDTSGGGTWTLTGALVGGYSDSDTARLVRDNLVAGLHRARGSHDGTFASPSLGLELSHPVGDRYELRPSVRADALIARHGSYAESGAGMSDLAYGSRTSVSAEGRAQLGLAVALEPSAEFEARAGAMSRMHAREEVTARPARGGASATYAVPGERRANGWFVGGRLARSLGERFSLAAAVEYGRASGGERTVAGRLKLDASF